MTEILLGHDKQTNQRVMVKPWEFALGGYFIGVRRMGKSTLLESLCVQSIKNGHGMTLIDPHGDLLQSVINNIPQQRLHDVILVDPKDYQFPFGLNIYHCENKDNPLAVEYTVNLVMDLYKKLWKSEYSQPMVEDIILMTTLTIIANDMTMVEVPKLLFDDAFRQRLLKNMRNPDVLDFWKIYDNPRSIEREQGGGTVGRRLRQFTTSGIMRYIFGQNQKILQLREVLDKKKILLIRLYSDLPQLTSLIGSTVVSQMLQAALSRSDTDKRPEHHLYCDEYSRFAVESFAQIIEEAGKYNIIPFIAHQSTGQISEENQDSAIQLGNLFCFKLIGRDAEELASAFDLTPKQAILPPGTVPRQVLPRLEHHAHSIVKSFWRQYVLPLDQALKKQERERRSTNFLGDEITDTILPKHDFGMGMVEYRTDDVQHTYNLLNDLFYEVMRNSQIDQEKEVKDLLAAFASLLKFQDFYDWHNLGKPWDMKPYLIKITLEAIEQTATLEEEIAKINGYLTNDDTFVQHLLGGHVLRDNAYIALSLDECYADLKKQANLHAQTVRELGSFAGFVETLRKGVAHQLAELEKERERLLKNIRLTPSQELRLWYHKNVKYGTKNMYYQIDYDREELIRIEAKIATLKQELASEEVLLEEWQKADYPSGARKKGIHVAIAETLASHAENVAYYQQTDTPEKYLAYERRKLEQKRDEKRGAIESINTHRQHEYERTRESLDFQKQIYLAFVTGLKKVIEILTTDEGVIEVQSTTWQDQPTIQQSYADRKNQIANELTQMPRFTAHVKLPHGEHIIKTIQPGTPRDERAKYDEKRTQVVKQTRENYCTPRAEVEKQIRQRQENDTPSTIKRTHTL